MNFDEQIMEALKTDPNGLFEYEIQNRLESEHIKKLREEIWKWEQEIRDNLERMVKAGTILKSSVAYLYSLNKKIEEVTQFDTK